MERVDRLNKILDDLDKEGDLLEEGLRKSYHKQARVRAGENILCVLYALHFPVYVSGTVSRLGIFDRVEGSVRTIRVHAGAPLRKRYHGHPLGPCLGMFPLVLSMPVCLGNSD